MPTRVENITGIYERKLMRKLLQTDAETKVIFNKYVTQTSDIFSRYRADARGIVVRNADLDNEFRQANEWLRSQLDLQIKNNQQWAFLASNDKNDEIVNAFIEDLPLPQIVHNQGLFARNLEAFNNFSKRKVEGLSLSNRVWNLSEKNTEMMNYFLESGQAVGRPAADIARDIRQLLNEPDRIFRRVRDPETGKLVLSKAAEEYHPGRGVYRSSVKNAQRLARTETNMSYRAADYERWQRLDFVIGYEVKLSNAHPAPDICDEAAGQYPKDFKFIGWHPQCLCHAVPVLTSDENFMDWLVGDAELEGQITDVPAGFKNWIEKNQDKIQNWNKQPFFVRDNFVGGRIENGLKPNLISGIVKGGEAVKVAEFIPAKTIEEAKERFINAGIDKQVFGIASLDQINLSLKTIENEYKFAKHRINKIEFKKLSTKTAASFQKINELDINLLNINVDEFGKSHFSIVNYKERLKKLESAHESNLNSLKFYESKLTGNKKTDLRWKTEIKRIRMRDYDVDYEIIKINEKINHGFNELPYTYATGFNNIAAESNATIVHELGHYWDEVKKSTINNSYIHSDLKNISEYCFSERAEYFAEIYTKWRINGDNDIPNDLLKIFKSIK